jgi:cellulose synthase/poly-beta-1,6-N-acetylglucosamine synthase-like glycosyltransferase
MISVSIIIPAWNEARVLTTTIQALLDVEYDRRMAEIIVVAGGDDNTYDIAITLSAIMKIFGRYVVISQGKGRTKNAAIQQGVEEAQNEVIVLLDADTVVTKRWLKNMMDPIAKGICELTIANSEPLRRNWISDYYMVIKTYFLDNISTYPGHSIAFRADILKNRVNYFFDANIWMGDDYVFEKRVNAAGKKTMFVKDARVKTRFPCSLKYFLEIELRWWTAFISMNGVNYRTLTFNTIVIGAVICLLPFSWGLFKLSVLFNALYVSKRAYMFFVASRQYKTRNRRVFGFVLLSYIHHIISLLAHVRVFLGLWKDTYYQGQRF